MIRYAIRHETNYTYGAPVDLGLHLLRMTPASNGRQNMIAHELLMTPTPHHINAFTDHFGNGIHQVAVEAAHESFSVVLETTVDITPTPWDAPPPGPAWEIVRAAMENDGLPLPPEVAEFIAPSPLAPHDGAATAYTRVSFPENQPIVAGALDLLKRFRTDFKYAPGVTDVSTPVSEVMTSRSGVCQDFAHAMISGLRGLGLPARYVSGYLHTAPAGGMRGADASHAWVSLWCGDELGWLEFDPTNNVAVGTEHIAVAYGRDYSDVAPTRGVILGGGQHALAVAVQVDQINAP